MERIYMILKHTSVLKILMKHYNIGKNITNN